MKWHERDLEFIQKADLKVGIETLTFAAQEKALWTNYN